MQILSRKVNKAHKIFPLFSQNLFSAEFTARNQPKDRANFAKIRGAANSSDLYLSRMSYDAAELAEISYIIRQRVICRGLSIIAGIIISLLDRIRSSYISVIILRAISIYITCQYNYLSLSLSSHLMTINAIMMHMNILRGLKGMNHHQSNL